MRGDLRLTRRSFAAAPRLWTSVPLASLAVCVGMGWIGNEIGGSSAYLYGEFRVEGLYGGLMTAVSAFLLGAAAVALLMVAVLLRRDDATRHLSVPWAVAGSGLLLLGADDLLMLHEIVGYRLAVSGVPSVLGIGQQDYLMVAYAGIAVLLLGRLLETLRRFWLALLPLVLGVVFFVLAELLDALVPMLAPDGLQALLAPTDRIAKTLGTVMTLAFAQTLLFEVATRGEAEPGTARNE